MILRVVFRYRCDYELHHHLNIGRAIGLSEDDIAASESESASELASESTASLGAAEAGVLRLTDLILTNHTLSEAERAEALDTLTVNQLADLTITVGFYQLVCNFLNTFGVTPDGEGAGQLKVHHLNCGTMNTPGAPLVCHVLLVEADHGLVLIDSGIGSQDCTDPARVGPFRHLSRPVFRQQETAAYHVEQLGFRRSDVRDIVLTHFDFDHIGGLADFPDANVHVTAAEARGAVHAPSWRERLRYRSVQWAHGPTLVEHDTNGESWRGFSAKPLDAIGDGVVLVPMPGHTRGHAAVAVDAGQRWILHCGDAFYHSGSLTSSGVPFVLRAQEEMFAFSRKHLHQNQERLAELYERRDPDLLIVCAHDPGLLEQARQLS